MVQLLPAVLKHLHFQTSAEGLLVVVDSDDAPEHSTKHEEADGFEPKCRLCTLQAVASECLGRLSPVAGQPGLRVAVGLAVPSMESWLLSPRDPHATEAYAAQLRRERRAGAALRRRLKRDLYGTDRQTLPHQQEIMSQAARRIVDGGFIGHLEAAFPVGFGTLARGIRRWRSGSG